MSGDPKQKLFGFPDAERLTAAGLDGWYLVESNPRFRTVMSWQRQNWVASGVRTADAEEMVTAHNKALLATLDPDGLERLPGGRAAWIGDDPDDRASER